MQLDMNDVDPADLDTGKILDMIKKVQHSLGDQINDQSEQVSKLAVENQAHDKKINKNVDSIENIKATATKNFEELRLKYVET